MILEETVSRRNFDATFPKRSHHVTNAVEISTICGDLGPIGLRFVTYGVAEARNIPESA